MINLKLNIPIQDLYFFDIYLRELLIKKPATSLGTHGSSTTKPHGYNIKYEVGFKKNDEEIKFEINLQKTKNEIKPISISVKNDVSSKRIEYFKELIVSRIREAERKAIQKPMKKFEYEAQLSTGHYPIKSTIKFGKFTLSPLNERNEKGWLCKLNFTVEAINKRNSETWALFEVREITALLSLIFCKIIQFYKFTEPTAIIENKTNYEEIVRPDLRPVKHPFAGELKIPNDFQELWNNYQSLSPDLRNSFTSSCICFQTAKEMNITQNAIAYTLFVTAIEVISDKVIDSRKTAKRFKLFISENIGKSDSDFMNKLGRFYGQRSTVLHNVGIGMGILTMDGIISFDVVSGSELWELEIITNAALIGWLKNRT